MSSASRTLPYLSDQERNLLIELLERERRELSPEIHHTNTPEMRDQLHRRKELVERLLTRMVSPETT